MRIHLLSVIYLILSSTATGQPTPLYKDPKAPIEERVQDLLKRMTPEEKFWQLFMIPGEISPGEESKYYNGIFGFQVSSGSQSNTASAQLLQYNANEDARSLARKINSIQKYFIERSRLGIPIIAFDEALHGLVRKGATAFPQSIALAATWDTSLMRQVSTAIALETKVRGIRDILSPVVNLATDVRWGRTEETYGEDPFLTAMMGMTFVSSFEKMGIITTPKHFLANVGDGGRDSYPIHLSDLFMAETHLYPFKELITKGGSRSIMTSYNSINGKAASANDDLLTKKLKGEWSFTGFVISDAGAVGGSLVLHNTAKDYPESGQQAINAGLDVIFQTNYDHYKLFIPPFLDGRIPAKRVDDAVARVLRAKFELGLFENPYLNVEEVEKMIDVTAHRKIAEAAAAKSFVLLKNDGTLPLARNIKSLAVIGTDAVEARLGGYSGPGNNKISILEGLKSRMPDVKINYAAGYERQEKSYRVIPTAYLLNANNEPGLSAQYFDNPTLSGNPVMERIDKEIDFHWTLFSPDEKLKKDHYSVRWQGKLIATSTGPILIGLEGNDGYRLHVNGELLIDQWNKQSYHTILKEFLVENGKEYDIKVEFTETAGNATIKLVWDIGSENSWSEKIGKALRVANESEAIIAVLGIHEGEFQDRAFLNLPAHQEDLIKALVSTGKPVHVLLVGGSAITMDKWIDEVNSVVMVWYPGETGGYAVADMLTGIVNPSGKLPITFPIHESQLPLVYNHKPTGRGDDYHNLSGLPLFPFGFGLSYTQFEYKDIQLSKVAINDHESARALFTLKNIGKISGEEVVQLYIRDELASLARPVLELKGFQKIFLQPGEEKKLEFIITPDMLKMLNSKGEEVVEPGTFRIMIGSSSRQLPLKKDLLVK